jgi:hypothetical protein
MLRLYVCVFAACIMLGSCKDTAGEGGDARIMGKVYAHKYNASFTYKFGSYYEPDQKVYLVYDNDLTASDNVDTNFDGTYEFRFLRRGKYRVYVYSKDSTGAYQLKADVNAPKIPVIKNVEITKKKQTVVVPDIEILK